MADGAEGGLAAQTQGATEHLLSDKVGLILDVLHWLTNRTAGSVGLVHPLGAVRTAPLG